jgi:hypothetical protein
LQTWKVPPRLTSITRSQSSTVMREIKLSRVMPALATTFQKLHSKLGEATPSVSQLGSTLVDLTAHGVTGRAAVTALTFS